MTRLYSPLFILLVERNRSLDFWIENRTAGSWVTFEGYGALNWLSTWCMILCQYHKCRCEFQPPVISSIPTSIQSVSVLTLQGLALTRSVWVNDSNNIMKGIRRGKKKENLRASLCVFFLKLSNSNGEWQRCQRDMYLQSGLQTEIDGNRTFTYMRWMHFIWQVVLLKGLFVCAT